MNTETLIRAAVSDGLRLELTDVGTVKCIGPRLVTERWALQLRQHKAEILAMLNAANDALLPADQEHAAMAIAEQAIARAALTDEQKASRLNDLRSKPEIAGFWAALLDPTITTSTPPPRQTLRRCVECEHFARVGVGERCAHPDRSPPGEPQRAECRPAYRCERCNHWRNP